MCAAMITPYRGRIVVSGKLKRPHALDPKAKVKKDATNITEPAIRIVNSPEVGALFPSIERVKHE